MEAMRIRLEESEGEQRNNCVQLSTQPRARTQGRGYFNGRGRSRGRSAVRGGCMMHRGGKYYHAHGNCAHMVRECETPTVVHNETAKFSNTMSGSDTNCD